jgi:hypothetical protein
MIKITFLGGTIYVYIQYIYIYTYIILIYNADKKVNEAKFIASGSFQTIM